MMLSVIPRIITGRLSISKRRIQKTLVKRLREAIQFVPFYQDLAKENGIDFSRINKFGDFIAFPIVDSRDYREAQINNGADYMIDRRFLGKTPFEQRSSGSTGVPLVMNRTSGEHYTNVAKTIIMLQKSGLMPWGRTAAFVTPDRIVTGDSKFQKLGLYRRKTIGYSEPGEIVDLLHSGAFSCIYGTRAHVELVAEAAIEKDKKIKIKSVLIGSEIVTERAREVIQRAFEPIFFGEWYGAVETGVIAHKLSERYNVMERTVHVREGSKVDNGSEAVLSSLVSRSQPILNYRNGDYLAGTISDDFGTVTSFTGVSGRLNDYLITIKGTKWSGIQLYSLVEACSGVANFRVDHHRPGELKIYIKFESSASEEDRLNLNKRVSDRCSNEFEFEIIETNELRPLDSGKYAVVQRFFD